MTTVLEPPCYSSSDRLIRVEAKTHKTELYMVKPVVLNLPSVADKLDRKGVIVKKAVCV